LISMLLVLWRMPTKVAALPKVKGGKVSTQ